MLLVCTQKYQLLGQFDTFKYWPSCHFYFMHNCCIIGQVYVSILHIFKINTCNRAEIYQYSSYMPKEALSFSVTDLTLLLSSIFFGGRRKHLSIKFFLFSRDSGG